MTTETTDQGATTAFIERNMVLAFWYMRQQIERPELASEVPDGATLVLLPDNDPELAAFNRARAVAEVEAGKNVYIRHVRPDRPAFAQ